MPGSSRAWGSPLAKGAVGLIFVVFLLLGLKGCVVSIWTPEKESVSYVIEGEDKRSMRITFFPNHETMIWYNDPSGPRMEGVLTRMRGTYGTHYFGPLWKIDGPGVFFGYRIYDEDVRPVMMEIRIIDKFMQGRGDSSFRNTDSTTNQIVLFGKGRLQYLDMWFVQERPNPDVDKKLRLAFKKAPQ
jgi:hypothetical protein